MFDLPDVTALVRSALAEDLGVAPDSLQIPDPALLARDVTSAAVVGEDTLFTGVVRARQAGVVAGLPVAARVFEVLAGAVGLFDAVEFFPLVAEGSRVEPGVAVAEVEGLARAVMAGERTALNLLMDLSGIATETARWVEAAGPGMSVCDTRKTHPGMRTLAKYAVRVGGGTNHRAGLYDMVLVKDNHLRHAASVTAAVESARSLHPQLLVEVEADRLEQAIEAIAAGADLVLLDNMDDSTLAAAVAACRQAEQDVHRSVLLEASGGIHFERLAALRASGVDRVSSSALTLAAPLDFGLDESGGSDS